MRRVRRHPHETGLTLIEVIAATAVLLIGAAATTGLFSCALRQSGRDGAALRLQESSRETVQALLALPFRADDGAPDLISQVFPHAQPALSSAAARFLVGAEDGAPAGSFVTERREGDLQTRLVATFVRLQTVVPEPLPVDQVIGWSGAAGTPAPSAILLVSVVVTGLGASNETTFLAAADRDVRRAVGGEP